MKKLLFPGLLCAALLCAGPLAAAEPVEIIDIHTDDVSPVILSNRDDTHSISLSAISYALFI